MPKEKRKFVIDKKKREWKDKVARKEEDKIMNPWGDALKKAGIKKKVSKHKKR